MIRVESPVKTWVFVITGFLQDKTTESRMIELWKRAHDELLSPDHIVALRSWKADWAAEAEFVKRMSVEDPRIVVIAYSWGAGWGFTQLAKQLGKRLLFIHKAILSDPVRRDTLYLQSWRTFFPSHFPIAVPANVRSVESFAQTNNWPRAHRLVAQSPNTRICPPIHLDSIHAHMDDHPHFIDRALAYIEEL